MLACRHLGLEDLIKGKRIIVHKESSKDLSRFKLDLFLKKIPKCSGFPAKRTPSMNSGNTKKATQAKGKQEGLQSQL